MKVLANLRSAAIRVSPVLTARPAVEGLVTQRELSAQVLEQTRTEIRAGTLVASAAEVLKGFETAIAGPPPAGLPGIITVRAVASADSRAGLPALPLSRLRVVLKLRDAVAQQEETDALGMAYLALPNEPKGAYQLDLLAPDGTLLLTTQGRWTTPQPSPVQLLEVARSDKLKVQLENASPFEAAILKARERTKLVQQAAAKALAAQETRLAAYVNEVDAAVVEQNRNEALEIATKPQPAGGAVAPPAVGGLTPADVRTDPVTPPRQPATTRKTPERPAVTVKKVARGATPVVRKTTPKPEKER